MPSSDETTQTGQTTGEFEAVSSTDTLETEAITENLGHVMQPPQRRSELNERRSTRQTGPTERGTGEIPGNRATMRQAVLLREENRRLRQDFEEQRAEFQRLISEHTVLQEEHEKEIAVIHSGHQQEIEQYQTHMHDILEERTRLQEAQQQMEQRYQDLYHSFQRSVEDEAHKMVLEAAQTVEIAPTLTPGVLQNVKKTIELQVRQEEDKHLLEAMYLKREVQQMVDALDQERRLLAEERQHSLAMQNSIREQAATRYKALQDRLKGRARVAIVISTISMLFCLIALQHLFLYLTHALSPQIAFSLMGPIIFCVLLSIILAGPLLQIKHIYTGAPHKKKTKEAV